MKESDESSPDELSGVADRLVAHYGIHDEARADMVRRVVAAEAQRFAGATLQSFVPILVERAVRHRLDTPGR